MVIPHFRDLANLDLCLSALQAQSLARKDFEVVVADNASPEGKATVAAVIAGRARLVVIGERGAGPARNGGVAATKAPILAFIDSDCRPEPRWLEEGLAALENYDFVGGRVKVVVCDPSRMTAEEAFERVFAFDFKAYITRKGFTGSGNLFCPRSLFDAVGGFRAGVSEDVDWSHRALAAGFRLGYAPHAIVGHPGRRTWRELCDKWRRVQRETFAFVIAKKGGHAWWFLRALALPLSAVIHSPKVLVSPELQFLSQRLAALGVLYRVRFWRFGNAFALLAGIDR